jgi:hypothetical protein
MKKLLYFVVTLYVKLIFRPFVILGIIRACSKREMYTKNYITNRKLCLQVQAFSRALPDFVGRNLYRRYFSHLKSYGFEISATFQNLGWIDAPHTQNFENS